MRLHHGRLRFGGLPDLETCGGNPPQSRRTPSMEALVQPPEVNAVYFASYLLCGLAPCMNEIPIIAPQPVGINPPFPAHPDIIERRRGPCIIPTCGAFFWR